MSRSKANSAYKRLLHRSLHKSTKAHLMKVYDPGHRDLHTSYDTAEGSESMLLSTFIWFQLVQRALFIQVSTCQVYQFHITGKRHSLQGHTIKTFHRYLPSLDVLLFYQYLNIVLFVLTYSVPPFMCCGLNSHWCNIHTQE